MLEALAANPLTLRLGWTLVHSLWQGLLLALLFGAGLLLLKPGRRTDRRPFLATLVLLLWLALPVVTFALLPSSAPRVATITTNDIQRPEQATTGLAGPDTGLQVGDDSRFGTSVVASSNSLLPSASQVELSLQSVLPYAAFLWLTVASLLSLRLLGGILLVKHLRRLAKPLPELQGKLDTLSARLGIHRRVSLLSSTRVDSPIALGLLRPAVLLPVSALTGLNRDQLELILAHELAHIRRNDYLINILQGVAEALLFYHPLTWWLSSTLRVEREHACDELALQATGSRSLMLAEALTRLETNREPPRAALAATSNLTERVRRLSGRNRPASLHPAALATTVGALLLGLWLAIAVAQLETNDKQWAVVIDPAHSDLFPGASGAIDEADLTLTVAKKVKALLESQEVQVQLTREGNEALASTFEKDYQARAAFATPEHVAFITLHAGYSINDKAVQGVETYVRGPAGPAEDDQQHYRSSKRLAEAVHQRVTTVTRARDRGVRENDYLPLRLVRIPAASIDLGFLSNDVEGNQLASEEYQDLLAKALAEGVLTFVNGQSELASPPPVTLVTASGMLSLAEGPTPLERLDGNFSISMQQRTADHNREFKITRTRAFTRSAYLVDGNAVDPGAEVEEWVNGILSETVVQHYSSFPRDHLPGELRYSGKTSGGSYYSLYVQRNPGATGDARNYLRNVAPRELAELAENGQALAPHIAQVLHAAQVAGSRGSPEWFDLEQEVREYVEQAMAVELTVDERNLLAVLGSISPRAEPKAPSTSANNRSLERSHRWLTIIGTVTFGDGARTVTTLAPNATLILEERTSDGTARLTLTKGELDEICFELHQDSTTSTDCESQSPAWFTEHISDYLREAILRTASSSDTAGKRTSSTGFDDRVKESLIWIDWNDLHRGRLHSPMVGEQLLRDPEYQADAHYRLHVESLLSHAAHRSSHGLLADVVLVEKLRNWLNDEALTEESRQAWLQAMRDSVLPEILEATRQIDAVQEGSLSGAWERADQVRSAKQEVSRLAELIESLDGEIRSLQHQLDHAQTLTGPEAETRQNELSDLIPTLIRRRANLQSQLTHKETALQQLEAVEAFPPLL